MDELQAGVEVAFAVFPQSPPLLQPSKASFNHPPFGSDCEFVQFAAFVVAYLNEHKIRFCMRCDKVNGCKAMRALLDSCNTEATVTLKKAQSTRCHRLPVFRDCATAQAGASRHP